MSKLKLIVNNNKLQQNKNPFFVKKELKTILNLYAKMVSNGTWKDYGLSKGSKEISFDVYQRASDKPVFRILKIFKPVTLDEIFLIKDKNGQIIKKSENLNRLITKTNWNNLRVIK